MQHGSYSYLQKNMRSSEAIGECPIESVIERDINDLL